MDIVIPRDRLKKNIAHISVEEVISLLNEVAIIKRPDTSSNVQGILTEKNIAECIADFEITKSSSYSGDFCIHKKKYPNIKIMVEIKNYSGPIPRSQIEKFIHDIDQNQFTGGIFICNQPVAGYDLLTGHVAVVQTYDTNVINSVCELLWNFLFEKQFYKFIDYKNNITPYCNILLDNINDLVKIRKSVETLQKDLGKTLQNVLHGIGKTISTINDMTNNIINESSNIVITQKMRKFYLPEINNPILNTCRAKLVQTLEKLCSDESILLAHKANKYEYSIGGKKIMLSFLVSKIDISFEPAFFDFTGVKHISLSDGLLTIKITAKNNSDNDVYDLITKYW